MALGCATHTATVTDRNGGNIFAGGNLVSVTWNRLINDVSVAQIVVGVAGPDCCGQLSDIRSWRHSLNIYRADNFVWSGLVVDVDWLSDRVVITATDIIGLLDRRVPHQDFSFTGTDLVYIARDLVEDGLAPDDPGHTVTIMGESGVTGGRAYQKDIGQTADHLRDLSDTGIDFTAVGNNIVILPDDFCDVVGALSDNDLPDGLTVSEDGASLATRWVVAGRDTDQDNGVVDIVGTAGGSDAYYGLLERYVEDNNITTAAAADQAAAARVAASLPVPTVIETQNVTLSPNADVDIASLVPGWCVDITTAVTCRNLTQRLKITGLSVTEDGGSDGQPGQERILLQVAATAQGV